MSVAAMLNVAEQTVAAFESSVPTTTLLQTAGAQQGAQNSNFALSATTHNVKSCAVASNLPLLTPPPSSSSLTTAADILNVAHDDLLPEIMAKASKTKSSSASAATIATLLQSSPQHAKRPAAVMPPLITDNGAVAMQSTLHTLTQLSGLADTAVAVKCASQQVHEHAQSQQHHPKQQQQQQQQHNQNTYNDEARTLQLALELSLVGLDDQCCYFDQQQQQQQQQQYTVNAQQHQHHHHHHLQQQEQNAQLQKTDIDLGTLSAISAVIAANNPDTPHINIFSSSSHNAAASATVSGLLIPTTALEERSKKSQNMTECVPVPSSEHVAEIVGRQGCKIKALRAKTNTYIKTPVRGEEPVFVVTGRKEDVNKAKREILSAADHFSLIRATRKPSSSEGNGNHGSHLCGGSFGSAGGSGVAGGRTPAGPPALPGQITIQVRVPYRVVGLVVGPKGATIKHIQQETQTYIVTPSREKEPIFEVTGLPDNVQSARKQIEAHIALRTGNNSNNNNNNNNNASNTAAGGAVVLNGLDAAAVIGTNGMDAALGEMPPTMHTINTLSQMLNDDINPEFLASLYKNGICSTFNDYTTDGGNVVDVGGGVSVDVGMHVNNGGSGNNMLTTPDMSKVAVSVPVSVPAPQLDVFNNVVSGAPTYAEISSNRYQMPAHGPVQPMPVEVNPGAMVIEPHALNGFQEPEITDSAMYMQRMGNGSNNNNSSNNNRIEVKAITEAVTLSSRHMSNQGVDMTTSANSANTNNSALTRSCSSASSTASTKSTNNSAGGSSSSNNSSSPPELLNIWKNLGDSLEVDEGIGDSPNIWNMPHAATLNTITGGVGVAHCSPTNSISPTDSLLGDNSQQLQQLQRTSGGKANGNGNNNPVSNSSSNIMPPHQQHTAATVVTAMGHSIPSSHRRDCFVCNDKEVTTALVPCGHNMFCMACANQICNSLDSVCPVCNSLVYHAMRIIA